MSYKDYFCDSDVLRGSKGYKLLYYTLFMKPIFILNGAHNSTVKSCKSYFPGIYIYAILSMAFWKTGHERFADFDYHRCEN